MVWLRSMGSEPIPGLWPRSCLVLNMCSRSSISYTHLYTILKLHCFILDTTRSDWHSIFLSTTLTIFSTRRSRSISPTMNNAGLASHIHQVTDTHANIITEPADAEPEWRKAKFSLERPYKDDNGQPILTLLDITPDGQYIYEPFASTFPA